LKTAARRGLDWVVEQSHGGRAERASLILSPVDRGGAAAAEQMAERLI
jgi:hypothetical protein